MHNFYIEVKIKQYKSKLNCGVFSSTLPSKPKSLVCRDSDWTWKLQPVLPHAGSGIPHVCVVFSLWSKLFDILGHRGMDTRENTEPPSTSFLPSVNQEKGRVHCSLGTTWPRSRSSKAPLYWIICQSAPITSAGAQVSFTLRNNHSCLQMTYFTTHL